MIFTRNGERYQVDGFGRLLRWHEYDGVVFRTGEHVTCGVWVAVVTWHVGDRRLL